MRFFRASTDDKDAVVRFGTLIQFSNAFLWLDELLIALIKMAAAAPSEFYLIGLPTK